MANSRGGEEEGGGELVGEEWLWGCGEEDESGIVRERRALSVWASGLGPAAESREEIVIVGG